MSSFLPTPNYAQPCDKVLRPAEQASARLFQIQRLGCDVRAHNLLTAPNGAQTIRAYDVTGFLLRMVSLYTLKQQYRCLAPWSLATTRGSATARFINPLIGAATGRGYRSPRAARQNFTTIDKFDMRSTIHFPPCCLCTSGPCAKRTISRTRVRFLVFLVMILAGGQQVGSFPPPPGCWSPCPWSFSSFSPREIRLVPVFLNPSSARNAADTISPVDVAARGPSFLLDPCCGADRAAALKGPALSAVTL